MDIDRPTWRSRAWIVAAVVLTFLVLVLTTVGVDNPTVGRAAVVVAVVATASVISWALLRTRTQRQRYEEELSTWAAERAAQTERLRIASDLHDLVSHGLGLITVRAAVARRTVGDTNSEQSDALVDIEQVSRETTTELRRMLTVLRTPGPVPLRPADTLDDLPSIVETANTAGLSVTMSVGDLGEVSPGAQLTVCAVVREAMNNSIRHAGPTEVVVTVERDGGVLVVDVCDAGPRGYWQAQPGAGHGLDRLRERVTALGGTIRFASEALGFRVNARILDRDSL